MGTFPSGSSVGLTVISTQFADQRKISLRLSASLDDPAAADDHDYFVGRSSRVIAETSNQLVTGRKVYLNFAVEDTGCGLNEEERQRLFMRFSQANQRTHVQYGVGLTKVLAY